ncbi:DUF711 family protein [Nostoc sp. NOS(2021)]|uniref:DUF711 family protein n=1 Tax=Nostoc sp. NOS(2021) TaxID=2815407 RepID=UPI0034599319
MEIINYIQTLEEVCQSLNISFFNIGYASKAETIDIIPDINKNTSIIYCSSKIGDRETGINFENAKESAKAIKRISQESQNGYGNFSH